MTFWWGFVVFVVGFLVGALWGMWGRAPRASRPPGFRADPVPPPLGWYWQMGESGIILGNGKHAWGMLHLVPVGREIDDYGLYVDRAEDEWPIGPRWHRIVARERNTRRESIKLLREMTDEAARKAALEQTRRRLDEQS